MNGIGGALADVMAQARAVAVPGKAPSPAPVCPRCKGAGYVRRDVPVGHADFGRSLRCPERCWRRR